MIDGQLAARVQLHRDVADELTVDVLRHANTDDPACVRSALVCVLLIMQSQRPEQLAAGVVKHLLKLP